MNVIINFATKFFEMFTKKQSEHPQKVFQVFRVFQVFHFAFGPQNRSFLVQIRTNPKNRYPATSAIKWVRQTPKKAIHPLVYLHIPVRQAIGVVYFRRSRLFILFHTSKAHSAIIAPTARGQLSHGEGGFIFVARHKSGQSYPFLYGRAVDWG